MKASQVIGYSLRVLKDGQPLFLGVPMPGKEPVKVYQSGSITPQIDSYYQDPTTKKVYWTFQNPGGALSYYIEHKSGKTFELVKLPTTDIIQGQPPEDRNEITLPDFGNIISESSKYLFLGGLIILAILIAKK
jgi:hypothetical protein